MKNKPSIIPPRYVLRSEKGDYLSASYGATTRNQEDAKRFSEKQADNLIALFRRVYNNHMDLRKIKVKR